MEKKDYEEIAKIMKSVSSTKKPIKDVRTSTLQDLNDEVTDNPACEYFKKSDTLGNLRSRLVKEDGNNLTKDGKGNTIVNRIDAFFSNSILSSKPVVVAEGNKYRFRDGSEADLPSLKDIMTHYENFAYANLRNQIQTLLSDARAEIDRLDKDMWKERKSFKLCIPTIGEITIEGT